MISNESETPEQIVESIRSKVRGIELNDDESVAVSHLVEQMRERNRKCHLEYLRTRWSRLRPGLQTKLKTV